MKKDFLALFAFVLVVTLISFSSASTSDTQGSANMTVRVNVLAKTISISVPDNLYFGNTAPGYITDLKNFSVTNFGTTDIKVTPQLENNSNENLFTNLFFKRTKSSDSMKIGSFELEINKPSVAGSERIQNAYIQLDLTNYTGNISGNVSARIIFTAVPI